MEAPVDAIVAELSLSSLLGVFVHVHDESFHGRQDEEEPTHQPILNAAHQG